jgi:hypothetical protein
MPPTPKGCGLTPKTEKKDSECDKIITVPQYSGVCWFTSILMSLFFSQYSRNLLLNKLENMPLNDVSVELRAIFWDIMQRRYKSSYEMKDYAYMFFQIITPENILKQLHKMNPKEFSFDPEKKEGYFNYLYTPRLLQFMGAKDILLLDYDQKNKSLYHSVVNGEFELEHTKGDTYNRTYNFDKIDTTVKDEYDVVLMYVNDMIKSKNHLFKKSYSIAKTFTHNKKTYVLDSMMIGNFNSTTCNRDHDICGITCEDKRYMYNGWIRHTKDASMLKNIVKRSLPCELMEYDWLNSKEHFCINAAKCSIDSIAGNEEDLKRNLCFNVSKGDRLYIYVNKNRASREATPKSPKTPNDVDFDKVLEGMKKKSPKNTKQTKECPPGKVINPTTGRCIKAKEEKQCPPGKMINPETGRCIKAKEEKQCPPGKMINPKTGRCIKAKEEKQDKKLNPKTPDGVDVSEIMKIIKNVEKKKKTTECPPGKVRNPKTGRCINEKKAASK